MAGTGGGGVATSVPPCRPVGYTGQTFGLTESRMPFVVNGVGTWQYGKRNVHRLRAACGQCGAVADLESYDTTLYIVVFYVPVLPGVQPVPGEALAGMAAGHGGGGGGGGRPAPRRPG